MLFLMRWVSTSNSEKNIFGLQRSWVFGYKNPLWLISLAGEKRGLDVPFKFSKELEMKTVSKYHVFSIII